MVDEEHPTTKSDSKPYKFTYEKPNDTIIFGNDKPKRKQKMRDLDIKPKEERQTKVWSVKKKAFWIFIFVTFASLVIYALNHLTGETPF